MHLVYISSVRIPNEKASGLAIVRQCEAFALAGLEVTLLRPHRINHIVENSFQFYGMEKSFDIYTMKSVDYRPSIGMVSFYISRMSQMLMSALYLYKHSSSVEIIYARDFWMLIFPILLFKGKKKIVWEAHQMQYGFWLQFVLRSIDGLVCITQGLAEYYNMYRVNRVPALIEPSGVNIDQFKDLPNMFTIRERFSIPVNVKVIGYIGKLKTFSESKGVEEIIRAFAHIQKEQPSTHLLIVGLEDAEFSEIEQECKSVGLNKKKYTLLPLVQKDFALYVHMCDILVMNYPDTNHYKNYMSPTKLFAYMAGKKLIVTSDLPSIREVVDESMVIFTESNNITSLVGGIRKAINHRNNKLIEQAFYRCNFFSWKSRAMRIINYIDSI